MPSGRGKLDLANHPHSLIHLFDEVAHRKPKAISIADGSRVLTYEQLLNMSKHLGSWLKNEYGLAAGDRAALQISARIETVVTILAILRCRASYVPLDTTSPPARNQAIIEDCDPKILISDEESDVDTKPIFVKAIPLESIPNLSFIDSAPLPEPEADDLCYTIYTSGTTGPPKGLPITHRNVTSLFSATDTLFSLDDSDVWTLYHSISFDYSVWEIWGALLTGATLIVIDPWEKFTPEKMVRKIAEHGVTVLNLTPTEFDFLQGPLMEQVAKGHIKSLRYIVFGGERLHSANVRKWLSTVGDIKPELINMYGLTEATVHATYYRVKLTDIDAAAVPVGFPLPGFEYLILDHNGQSGSEGELLLAGPQVATGYLNRPELTRGRFTPEQSPVDGETVRMFYRTGDLVRSEAGGLVHLGRNDEQVKLRGYRIELGEVADAASRLPDVGQVCILADNEASAGPRLLCAYTTERGGPLDTGLLRRLLRVKIPHYMVPEIFHYFTELPITVNGKTDTDRIRHEMELAT